MKNPIAILLLLFIACNLQAQSNGVYNDDIDLSNSSFTFNCSHPDEGDWGLTHGSPDFNNTTATTIYMWDFLISPSPENHSGEGVYRTFNFGDNTYYEVTLGIADFLQNHNTGDIVIMLTNSTDQDCSTVYGENIPDFTVSTAPANKIVYTYIGNGTNDLTNHEEKFSFYLNSGESYNRIVIYPKETSVNGNSSNQTITLEINYLNIINCSMIEDHTFCELKPGEYFQQNAYIGSAFCKDPLSFVSNDPDATTIVHAKGKIELKENTDLSVKRDNVVLLDISDFCRRYVPSKGAHSNNNNSTDLPLLNYISNNQLKKKANNTDIKISPNPAKNTLSVRFYLDGSSYSHIGIFDMAGRNVLSQSISGLKEGNQKIDLDISKLNPGSYLLELTTPDGKTMHRFAVTK